MELLGTAIMAVAGLVWLAIVPLGLPGLWIMVGGVLAYGWLTAFRKVGIATIAIVLAIAFLGEIIDNWLGFRFAKRYGGSTRPGWGALLGRAGGPAAKNALGLGLGVISVGIAPSLVP